MSKLNISNLNKDAGKSTGFGMSYHSVDDIPTLDNPNVESNKSKRVAADLSTLPESKEDLEGVVVKESVEEELLGKDSIFEKYMENKKKEVEELYAAIDAHNEMVAAQLGEEVPEEITDEDVARSIRLNSLDTEDDDIIIEDNTDDGTYIDPLERELDDDYSSNIDAIEKETTSKNVIANNISSDDLGVDVNFAIDEEDLLDDDEEGTNSEDDDKVNLEELQSTISDKLAPVSKKLNLQTFTISNKPISAKTVLQNADKKSVDWALFASKMHFALSEFSGTEISKLGSNSGLNQYSIVYNRYKLFLDHMIGENKPKDVESFVKSVSFLDNDDLFGGLYVANFNDTNYVPYDCPKCKYTFLSENIPMEEMYSFEKEEDKKLFNDIRNNRYYELTDLYTSEVVPITDKFAFSFREPSIYSIVFETALLDDKFTDKYQAIISVIAYIDNIYYIDEATQTITPIGYKRFNNNKMKDIKSRIITYAKIINSLSPDQYNIILAYLNSINSRNNGMKWKLPECTCPKCGTVIKERETSAENLVFMRHQLAALATTSLK